MIEHACEPFPVETMSPGARFWQCTHCGRAWDAGKPPVEWVDITDEIRHDRETEEAA